MNRSFSLSASSSKTRNCRNFVLLSYVRGDPWAERLDKQWRELRRHMTVEKDPDKMLRLRAEFDLRKPHTEALVKRSDNF